jgi:hypothetical protein
VVDPGERARSRQTAQQGPENEETDRNLSALAEQKVQNLFFHQYISLIDCQ